MQAGPVAFTLVGFIVFSGGILFSYIFLLDKKMPRTTFTTFLSRLAIVLLCIALANITIVSIAIALGEEGHVFMARYRIDTVIATAWASIEIFLLCVHDTDIYNNSSDVIKRRAVRSRQAMRDGKPAPKAPSTLLVAIKKSTGPIFAMIMFCLYGTAVVMAFQAATTDEMRLAVYCFAVVLKTGSEYLNKKMMEKVQVPYFAVVLGILGFDFVSTTQIKILLSSFPDAGLVAFASTLSAFFELGVRVFTLINNRREMSELKSRGLDYESTNFLVRKAKISAAVSRFRDVCP